MAWVMRFPWMLVKDGPRPQLGALGAAGPWRRLFPPKIRKEEKGADHAGNGRALTATAPPATGPIRGRGPVGPPTVEGPP